MDQEGCLPDQETKDDVRNQVSSYRYPEGIQDGEKEDAGPRELTSASKELFL